MVCFLWGRMRALRVPKRLGRLGSVPNDCGTRCGTKSSFNSAPWINYFRRITKHGLCGNTSAASTCRSCGSRFKPSRVGRGNPRRPPHLGGIVAVRHLAGRQQREGTEPLVPISCGVSLALRRCVDALPHAGGLSHAARRPVGPPADRKRGEFDGGGVGDFGPRGPRPYEGCASAGAASFRRQPTLEEALAEAENQVAELRKELEANPGARKTRQQAARCQRAAEQRAQRIRAVLEQLPKIAESKKAKRSPPRPVPRRRMPRPA